ncbi:RNA-binding S4 domain-containing protein [Photobacterium leiognathi]|uniref:RNA-binding S4 domain-containing protein n=1 Tax=Photobacterium leiognathi TaxID=553611 RepID=UPI002732E9E9|nr:RNA-binding S4 domain-containing protein [Photobacterium leiognathi]
MSEEIEVEAIGIEVSAQPIELYKVLKIANLVSGGGEAKYAISEGYVAVNGEVELRKRCKMYDGDVIEFNGEFYVVLCDQPVQEQVEQVKPKPVSKPAPKKTDKKKAPSNKPKAAGNRSVTKKAANKATEAKADTATGRKPISF